MVGFIPDIDILFPKYSRYKEDDHRFSQYIYVLLLSLFVWRNSYHEQEQHRHQQKQQALGGEEEEPDILCLLELLTLTMVNVNLDKHFYVS